MKSCSQSVKFFSLLYLLYSHFSLSSSSLVSFRILLWWTLHSMIVPGFAMYLFLHLYKYVFSHRQSFLAVVFSFEINFLFVVFKDCPQSSLLKYLVLITFTNSSPLLNHGSAIMRFLPHSTELIFHLCHSHPKPNNHQPFHHNLSK